MTELSIIIVNWNSKAFLAACLASVQRQTHGIAYEVIVIDSGSFDGCDRLLQGRGPQVRFIQSVSNLGFARANNEAFKVARGELLLFLNPDTELVGPAIEVLVRQLRELPEAGAVGCTLLDADGSVQRSCVQAFPTILGQLLNSELLRNAFPRWSIWGMGALFRTGDRPQPVQAVSGACILMRRSAFERIGRFSEEYFMYAEDLDLCHKARAAGLVNYHVGAATVMHFGGGSSDKAASGFSVVMMRESIWRFLTKTRGAGYAFGYRASTVAQALARLALLAALWPWQMLRGGGPAWRASCRKWRAILSWALHLEAAAPLPRRSRPQKA